MNPLSPLTYYRRHKRSTLLILILISLMTLGVCVMVGLSDTIWAEMYNAKRYLTRLSLVSAAGPALDPSVVSQIRTHPHVAQVIQEKGLDLELPQLLNSSHLFGVSETDMQVLMDTCSLRLKEGRLLQPRTNEMILSEEIANAMDIQIGDEVDRSIGEDWAGDNYYEAIPTPLELVGILEGTGSEPHIRLGFVSYEYVNDHELFEAPWAHGLVVIPREGRKGTVDSFLESEIVSSRTNVMTHRQLSERYTIISTVFHLIFGIVDLVVAVVIALVIGMINQIAQSKRLEEFGLLHALGYRKNRLIRRLCLETAGIAVLGWVIGLAISWTLFVWLNRGLYEPRGMTLSLANLTPIWLSLPIPLAAVIFVAFSTMRTFTRLDAVAIIERGKLGLEALTQQEAVRRSPASRSSEKPLSSWAFYRRHRSRALALVITIGLMILGVSFPAFFFISIVDAMTPFAEPLRQVGIVSPRMGSTIDPGLVEQIRANPDVARVIPAVEVPLRVSVPPFWGWPISIFGVTDEHMHILIDVHGVELKEGRLPQTRTSEIAISEGMALNRRLHVGDKIGGSLSKHDEHIPTEMVIVGILRRSSGQVLSRSAQSGIVNDLWLGFASKEYLSSHERYASWPISLLVIPVEGRNAIVETWLQENMDTDQTEVETFQWMLDNYRKLTLIFLLLFGLVEGIIVIVAAVALAVLSYTFFAQRLEEFGILHAIGRSRWWLVWRTAKETACVVAVAWLMGAVICGIGLLLMQTSVYGPRGLSLDFFNLAPWIFTLPIPVVVVVTSAGLVARILSRLDPVSIIERRS